MSIMKLNLEHFTDAVKDAEIIYLATSKDNVVTIRPVSPLLVGDLMTVYFYTGNDSVKYGQMRANPNVAFCVGTYGQYQVQGTVRFLGSVFSEKNKPLKEVYKTKYEFAFEVGAPGEDMALNEFIAIDIRVLKGWIFEGGNPVGLAEERFG